MTIYHLRLVQIQHANLIYQSF